MGIYGGTIRASEKDFVNEQEDRMECIGKKNFRDVYAISCVESYILAFLKNKGINISYLYCNSFISTNHVMNDIYIQGAKYADYEGIARIQDTAIELGILELKGVCCDNLEFLYKEEFEYLVGIKPESFSKIYGSQAWRDDHYVYVKKKSADEFYYLNDNPQHEMYLDVHKLKELYDDRYIYFRYVQYKIDKDTLLVKCLEQYKNEIQYIDCALPNIEYEVLRDMICLLRISRQRVRDFISEWRSPNAAWVDHINSVFTKIEYSRVRKRYTSDIFLKELDNIRADEVEIGQYLYDIKKELA